MKTVSIAVAFLAFLLTTLAASAQTTTTALTAYYSLKDALVATDAAKAKLNAAALSTALSTVTVGKPWAANKKVLLNARQKATIISKTTDIDVQREAFESLSTSMITLTKFTKSASQKVAPAYVQFCPMAAEGKGASWLSDKKEVRNPYYGDKMLKCGAVKEEI